jgi:hypothetical protein
VAPSNKRLWVGRVVRVGSPLLSHTLFPVYVAALIWGGLFLRDDRLRHSFLCARAADHRRAEPMRAMWFC